MVPIFLSSQPGSSDRRVTPEMDYFWRISTLVCHWHSTDAKPGKLQSILHILSSQSPEYIKSFFVVGVISSYTSIWLHGNDDYNNLHLSPSQIMNGQQRAGTSERSKTIVLRLMWLYCESAQFRFRVQSKRASLRTTVMHLSRLQCACFAGIVEFLDRRTGSCACVSNTPLKSCAKFAYSYHLLIKN